MAQRSGFGVVMVLVVLLIGLLLVIPMFAMIMWGPTMMGGGMMGGWGCPIGIGWRRPVGIGWGFMFAGALIPLVFIVLIVLGAYYLLTSRRETAGSGTALDILDERYAKGEIAKEQYIEMRQHLANK